MNSRRLTHIAQVQHPAQPTPRYLNSKTKINLTQNSEKTYLIFLGVTKYRAARHKDKQTLKNEQSLHSFRDSGEINQSCEYLALDELTNPCTP
jgi:hypothetical protein